MFHYIAWIWDCENAEASAAAAVFADRLGGESSWVPIFRQKGITVFCTGARAGSSEPYLLDGAGVILGKLFARSGGHSVAVPTTLGAERSRHIMSRDGRDLIDSYWGRYVAILYDEVRLTTWVIRDPTAGFPCLSIRYQGVEVYCSRMDDLRLLGLDTWSINWPYIRAALSYTRLELHQTGIDGISRVLGGECVEWSHGESKRCFYWDPLTPRDVPATRVQAAAILRERVGDCVRAWSSGYPAVVHTLSGGLDSSIVLACLRSADVQANVTCLTYFPEGSDMDERAFARMVAGRMDVELVERRRDSTKSLEALLRIGRSHAPANYLYSLEYARSEAALCAERGAGAIFSGVAGDQLFYNDAAVWCAVDYAMEHGLNLGLIGVALDAAYIDNSSVWRVLCQVTERMANPSRWRIEKELGQYKTLMRQEVLDDVWSARGAFIHPLLRDTPQSGARWWHAYQLLQPMEPHDALCASDDPERVAPLYSQPLLELCLDMPQHFLIHGGWDRAMARHAFRHDLPAEIVMRRQKGFIEEHVATLLREERNHKLMRELLLDGHLVRQGILDVEKVQQLLSDSPTALQTRTSELFEYLSTEAWSHAFAGCA